jgi:hypothetical protein
MKGALPRRVGLTISGMGVLPVDWVLVLGDEDSLCWAICVKGKWGNGRASGVRVQRHIYEDLNGTA